MTDINRMITVTKRFCQKVLLDSFMHDNEKRNDKLKDSLDHTPTEVLENANEYICNVTCRLLDIRPSSLWVEIEI